MQIDKAYEQAQANGHNLGPEVTKTMYNDLRTSRRCLKCGDHVIQIDRFGKPIEIVGLALSRRCD